MIKTSVLLSVVALCLCGQSQEAQSTYIHSFLGAVPTNHALTVADGILMTAQGGGENNVAYYDMDKETGALSNPVDLEQWSGHNGMRYVKDLDVASDGTVAVSLSIEGSSTVNGKYISTYNSSGTLLNTFSFSTADAVAWDRDDNLWIVGGATGYQVDPTDGSTIKTVTGMEYSSGVDFAANGTGYVTDQNRVRTFDPTLPNPIASLLIFDEPGIGLYASDIEVAVTASSLLPPGPA
ncbi:MAG: hypothetical protein CMJ81_11875 [Planctomycetaceae bacterium]|jgi:hypothetical protein|nr:hypothetical protein [Planctomycetaceae bacterium]MBP62690.1 hypothetical protein [Planctomycetaceae bacterium]